MKAYDVALLNDFNLPEAHRENLVSYYVLHWKFEYLIKKLNDDGTLTHADVVYIPVWKDSYISLNLNQQVRLSFRRCSLDENGYNYVLIKALDRNEKK